MPLPTNSSTQYSPHTCRLMDLVIASGALQSCSSSVGVGYLYMTQQAGKSQPTQPPTLICGLQDVIGDHLPDGTIHLPFLFFSNVKLPKNSCLGKCSACIQFAQQHLCAKSPLEASQFASACAHHLSLSSAERLSYKDCQQAKSHPSVYMSLIMTTPTPSHSQHILLCLRCGCTMVTGSP